MLKGKGPRKGFKGGLTSPKGSAIRHLSTQTQGSSSAPSTGTSDITCYFCHQKGHYKSQCPKWLALRSSSAYQQTRQQAPRLGMIFDHLEDTVFAPDSCCRWCADTTCDGTNCSSAFDPDDFHEATTLFMQQLQPLVANAKLDRPLDSHPSLSRELMLTRLVADDWGDTADGTQYEQDDHGSQNSMMTHIIIRNIKNIMSMTPRNTITAQILMNIYTWKSHTNMNRNTPRKAPLQQRARMTIRKNDGPVSRLWKANRS
jgi:hypothetical protein